MNNKPGAVNDFLKQIQEGLQNTTQSDVILFFIILFSLIIFLTIILIVKNYKARKRRIVYAEKSFKAGIIKLDINKEEEKLLSALVNYLPKGRERKYMLLENAPSFNYALKKLKQFKNVQNEQVNSLRFKLGFISMNIGKPINSSIELPVGLRILIKPVNGHTFTGRITEQQSEYLSVQQISKFQEEENLSSAKVLFQWADGVNSFDSRLIKRDSKYLYLKHSEEIHRNVHRQYFRKLINRMIAVTRLDSKLRTINTHTIDIGGGGLMFFNKDNFFKENDSVMIVLELPPKLKIKTTGKITKITSNGISAHMEFSKINETMRDKIIGYILSLKRSDH
jgi:hypothetical protein